MIHWDVNSMNNEEYALYLQIEKDKVRKPLTDEQVENFMKALVAEMLEAWGKQDDTNE